jgi:hypothetical protein
MSSTAREATITVFVVAVLRHDPWEIDEAWGSASTRILDISGGIGAH